MRRVYNTYRSNLYEDNKLSLTSD